VRPRSCSDTRWRIRKPSPPPSASATRRHGAVTDEQILAAYELLATREGLLVEPASAAPVAGVLAHRDDLPAGIVVCTLTGHGLKDPETAIGKAGVPQPVAATPEAVARSLGW
jgi:threonine synthase